MPQSFLPGETGGIPNFLRRRLQQTPIEEYLARLQPPQLGGGTPQPMPNVPPPEEVLSPPKRSLPFDITSPSAGEPQRGNGVPEFMGNLPLVPQLGGESQFRDPRVIRNIDERRKWLNKSTSGGVPPIEMTPPRPEMVANQALPPTNAMPPAAPPSEQPFTGPQPPMTGPPVPTRAQQIQSQMMTMDRPPSKKQFLLQALATFAPVGIAGLVGGEAAASGAAQGAHGALQQQQAMQMEKRKSLGADLQKALEMEATEAERKRDESYRRDQLATTERHHAETLGSQKETRDLQRDIAMRNAPDTVETDKGVYQFNPETQRHDIFVGAKPLGSLTAFNLWYQQNPGKPVEEFFKLQGENSLTLYQEWKKENPAGTVAQYIALNNPLQLFQGSDAERRPVLFGIDTRANPPTATPIPTAGAPYAAIKPTEHESRVLGFYERMVPASETMDKLEGDIQKLGFFGQLQLSRAPNVFQSAIGQRYRRAADDMINAEMRRESGAAVMPHEYARAEGIWLPVPGDLPQTLKDKHAARQNLLSSTRTEARNAYREKYGEIPTGGGDGTPKVGDTKTFPNGRKARWDGTGWEAMD